MFLVDLDNEKSENSKDDELIENIQSNYSKKIAFAHYARSQFVLKNRTSNLQKDSLNFCLKYHEFFHLNDNSNINIKQSHRLSDINNSRALKKTKTINSVHQDNELNQSLLTRDVNENVIDLNQSLKEFFRDKNATFKSNEQRNVIKAILNKATSVFFHAGTGSGKSLLFMLPAYVQSTTISLVALPLVSLKHNMLKRLQENHLNVEIFEETRIHSTNLQLISYESFKQNSSLYEYLNTQISQQKEIRIYFDEAHLIIMHQEFRYIMKYLSTINEYKIQLIFLTASLTNEIKSLLVTQFKLSNYEIFKTSTTRENIKYIIQEHSKNKSIIKDLNDYIEEHVVSTLLNDEKVLIYTQKVEDCEYIAKTFNILKYHARLSQEEKEENQQRFLTKSNFKSNDQFLVATAAFNEGLDYLSIRYVFHIFEHESLITVDQQIDRANRDNKNATSVIFVKSNYLSNENQTIIERNLTKNDVFTIDSNFYRQFLLEKKCLRRVLDNYFNNKYIECCFSTQNQCYLYEKRNIELKNKFDRESRLKASYFQSKTIFLSRFDDCLITCLNCKNNQEFDKQYTHTISNCFDTNNKFFDHQRRSNRELLAQRKLLKIGTCCFHCLLSQRICSITKTNNKCKYENVVFDLLTLIVSIHKRNILKNSILSTTKRLNQDDFLRLICVKTTSFNTDSILAIDIIQKFFEVYNKYESQTSIEEIDNENDINDLENQIDNFSRMIQNIESDDAKNSSDNDENIDYNESDNENENEMIDINQFETNLDLDRNAIQEKNNISINREEIRVERSLNYEDISSDDLSFLDSSLQQFDLNVQNEYKSYVQITRKENKAKISIMNSLTINDFVALTQIEKNQTLLSRTNSSKSNETDDIIARTTQNKYHKFKHIENEIENENENNDNNDNDINEKIDNKSENTNDNESLNDIANDLEENNSNNSSNSYQSVQDMNIDAEFSDNSSIEKKFDEYKRIINSKNETEESENENDDELNDDVECLYMKAQALYDIQEKDKNDVYKKLYKLTYRCVFCKLHNELNYRNHSSSLCSKYKRQFKHAYKERSKAQRFYTNTLYQNRKYQLICAECFISHSICFRYREEESHLKNNSRCILANDLFCYLFVIDFYKKNLKEKKYRDLKVERCETDVRSCDKRALIERAEGVVTMYIVRLRF